MTVLALDTSGLVASVAVSRDGVLLGEYTLNNGLTHSQRLLPMVDELLKSLDMKISDIDVFACSVGPGSFTGLRIGIATVKGFAFTGKKPCVAVSGLEAMAYNHMHTDYVICPLMDARAGQVYNAVYHRFRGKLKTLTPPRAVEIETVIRELSETGKTVLFLGDGVKPNLEKIKALGNKAVIGEFNNNLQRAATIALIAEEKANKGETLSGQELEAEYLRKSQAEREAGK